MEDSNDKFGYNEHSEGEAAETDRVDIPEPNESPETGEISEPSPTDAPEPEASNDFEPIITPAKTKKNGIGTSLVMIGVVVVVILAIAGGVGLFITNTIRNNDKYVLTYNGQKVSTEALRLFTVMYGDKDTALEILKDFLIITDEFNSRALTLSAEDEESLASDIDYLNSYIETQGLTPFDITEERLTQLMALNYYYMAIIDDMKAVFVVDEDTFNTEFVDFKENFPNYYTDVQLKYIITETPEDAEIARAMLLNGDDTDTVIMEKSIYYTPEYGIEVIPMTDAPLEQETIDEIMALDVAEFTNVVDLGGIYAIFIVDSITVPTDAEIEEIYREMYIGDEVYTAFNTFLDEQIATAEFKINQSVFDKFEQ